ncbi:MAG: hypothetical protein INR64_02045 [Caulobacteraceae bacterium]|nr:hypothetical protein [Caulobacter sp.]
MPDPATAHDAHVLDGLVAAVEASMRALETGETLPPAVRDQALARRGAVDELRAAGARREAGPAGDGLLEKAQRALERFAADVGDAPAQPAIARDLGELEAGEDALQRRFEGALADHDLSGPVRDAVLRAYDRVKPGHDAIRQAALAARGDA